VARPRDAGGCHDAAGRVRPGPHASEALRVLCTSARGVDDYPRVTRRVLGGGTWRTRGANLTDEVPRRSQGPRPGISSARRPTPKGGGRRRRARGVPWLSLLRDSSVSGGGRQGWGGRPRGHPCDRGVDEPQGTAPVSPRVPPTSGPPLLFREGHVQAKNRLKVMVAPPPRLVCSRRIKGSQAQPRGGRSRQTVYQDERCPQHAPDCN
jgi:hypothetical protein